MSDLQSLLTACHTALTEDGTLIGLMGGTVPVHLEWATPRSPMPYLVHNLRLTAGSWPMGEATYYLDGWDYAQTAERLMNISDRIRAILEGAMLTQSTDDAGNARFRLRELDWPAVDTEAIWHFSSVWSVRFMRVADINTIRTRKGGA